MQSGCGCMDLEQFDTHPVNDYQPHHILSAERHILRSAQNHSRTCLAKPASAGWWLRVLTVVLFVFHINYVPFHLLTETHFDDFHVTFAESAVHDDGHDDGDHHDSDHHKPHSVSDHLIQMVAKHQPSFLAVTFLPSETLVCLARPDSQVIRFHCERWKLPGESPPDPAQPRAPPLA